MATKTLRVRLERPGDFRADLMIAQALIDLQTTEDDDYTRDNMHQEIRRMADELAERSRADEVKHLAMTAAIAWFTMRYYELQMLGHAGMPFVKETLYCQRRVDAAHGRYLRTLKSLQRAKRRHAGDWKEDYERLRSLRAAQRRNELSHAGLMELIALESDDTLRQEWQAKALELQPVAEPEYVYERCAEGESAMW